MDDATEPIAMLEACRREGKRVTHRMYGTMVARRNVTCGCFIS